ncbi:hypothetical protein GTY41_06570 [Streptomyces sp. SID685]|uniref:hypothetical protein n=1 Tax=Streptomyces sp. SID685 TaxID=2690322 RepID=UPI0013701FDF|nr:hypothetical protein [Streptomyces sp. SID685]MYR84622.1 hypothetical protein [Streptomyces sp. SID685]
MGLIRHSLGDSSLAHLIGGDGVGHRQRGDSAGIVKGGAQEAVVDAQALDGGDGQFELHGVGWSTPQPAARG